VPPEWVLELAVILLELKMGRPLELLLKMGVALDLKVVLELEVVLMQVPILAVEQPL